MSAPPSRGKKTSSATTSPLMLKIRHLVSFLSSQHFAHPLLLPIIGISTASLGTVAGMEWYGRQSHDKAKRASTSRVQRISLIATPSAASTAGATGRDNGIVRDCRPRLISLGSH